MRHESGLQVIGPFEKSMFATEKIKQNILGSIIEKDHCDWKSANKLADLKTNYDFGVLWATWSDKRDSDFFSGKPIEIKKDGSWTVDGASNIFYVTSDGDFKVDLKDNNNSHFVKLVDLNTLEVTRQSD